MMSLSQGAVWDDINSWQYTVLINESVCPREYKSRELFTEEWIVGQKNFSRLYDVRFLWVVQKCGLSLTQQAE